MIAGILGQRGCGKSTLFKDFLRANPRVIVLDPLGEHSALGITVSSTAEFRAYWTEHYAGHWRIILQPHELLHERARLADEGVTPAEVLDPYVRLIERHAKRCLLAVDEAGHFGSAWHSDPRISSLAHYGRHRGVSLVWCARRPQEVAKVLRSQADALYMFRTTEDSDLAMLAGRIGHVCAGSLVNLPPYTAVLWQPGESPRYVRTTLDESVPARS